MQEAKIQMNQSITSQFKDTNLSQLSKNKSTIKEKEKEKCYEEELAKKVFRDISGKSDKNTLIEKIAFIEYLNANKKILKVLNTT